MGGGEGAGRLAGSGGRWIGSVRRVELREGGVEVDPLHDEFGCDEGEVVDGDMADGDLVEAGEGESAGQGGEQDADDHAVGDQNDGLARVVPNEFEHGRADPVSDLEVGLGAGMGGMEGSGGPEPEGFDDEGPMLGDGLAADGSHPAFVKEGEGLKVELAGGCDGLSGEPGAFHSRAVNGGGGEGCEGRGDSGRLGVSLVAEPDVGLGSVETIGRRGLGVPEQEQASGVGRERSERIGHEEATEEGGVENGGRGKWVLPGPPGSGKMRVANRARGSLKGRWRPGEAWVLGSGDQRGGRPLRPGRVLGFPARGPAHERRHEVSDDTVIRDAR